MNWIKFFFLFFLVTACTNKPRDSSLDKNAINTVLDKWHEAAANANYENYFMPLTEDAIFIGTDATENWNKEDFMDWAKPYFDRGKAWSFTSMERNIYFDKTGNTAWFDELLNTQMKICRGSGVLIKKGNDWKISQYVLSMTIPNDQVTEVVTLKAPIEDKMILKMKRK